MMHRAVTAAAIVLCAVACGSDTSDSGPISSPVGDSSVRATAEPTVTTSVATTAPTDDEPSMLQPCADVVAATVDGSGDTFRFDVTVRSGDTGWDKYADAWVVRTTGGAVLGERILLHPHVDEQPFTRSLSGVTIPENVVDVVIAARDSVNGFCGDTVTLRMRP